MLWATGRASGTIVGGYGPRPALGHEPVLGLGCRNGWLTLALVEERHTRQLLGWQLPHSGKVSTAATALKQEFITSQCRQQNGMVERLIRTLKEQCAHRHRFETQQRAMRVISDFIQFYNFRRPHQTLGMKAPSEAYALAA